MKATTLPDAMLASSARCIYDVFSGMTRQPWGIWRGDHNCFIHVPREMFLQALTQRAGMLKANRQRWMIRMSGRANQRWDDSEVHGVGVLSVAVLDGLNRRSTPVSQQASSNCSVVPGPQAC
jgi:hypothetical protein